jgi:hypothetical protein
VYKPHLKWQTKNNPRLNKNEPVTTLGVFIKTVPPIEMEAPPKMEIKNNGKIFIDGK